MEIAPGIWHWTVHDERIQFRSDAYAVRDRDGKSVLIDPHPLSESQLEKFGAIKAICLTAACHQRSAWRYRKKFGVKVWAPRGVRPMEENADVFYVEGDRLPGGLRAIQTPGPEANHYALLRLQAARVLFCPDLLSHSRGKIEYVPAEYHDDPVATRRSVRRLARFRFDILCFSHGAPILRNPQAGLKKFLASLEKQR